MKSSFSRLRTNNQRDAQPSSRSSSSQSLTKETKPPFLSRRSSSHSTHSFNPRRASTPIAALHSQSSSSSDSTGLVSTVEPIEDSHSPIPGIVEDDGDGTVRARTVSGDGNHVKKVTFRSPAPTPTASVALDDISMIPEATNQPATGSRTNSQSHGRTTPASPQKTSFNQPKPANQSRSSSRQSSFNVSKISTSRKSSLQSSSTPATTSDSASSPTPSEHSFGGFSGGSYLPEPNSWSEMAEEDLIANLGPRERTRQEVSWEIVSSEERYVRELVKLNETFCKALLPPSATSPSLNLLAATHDLSRTLSPALSTQSQSPISESFDYSPIAAQYSSSSQPAPATSTAARMDAYNKLTNGRPSEAPTRKFSSTSMTSTSGPRSHQSSPPPKRDVKGSGNHSRMSYHPGARSKAQNSRVTSSGSIASTTSRPIPLPEPSEKVLTVSANGILEGHIKLAAALRRRYDNQYPLVRSSADVFTAHSYILREYATYVLHLEKALAEVDNALTAYTSASSSKRASKRLEETELGQLGKTLLMSEELAAERGEAGSTISLSKPFGRLLKYPSLFQALLFHTDPSLKEYEATSAMVDEVQEIVRAIEDEKASWEERERTRDVWARIDGLERDKLIMAPKPNRSLVSEENAQSLDGDSKSIHEASARQKKSIRRSSDILKGSAESTESWIVKFSDVSSLCEKTGTTNSPLSSNFKGSRSDSMPEMSSRARAANMSKRRGSVKARNLYRFIKVHEWHLKPKTGGTEGLSSMDEISRARSQGPQEPADTSAHKSLPSISSSSSPQKPVHVPLKGDGGPSPSTAAGRRREGDTDTMVSDRMSVMSFAYKGSDQLRPVPRTTKLQASKADGSPGTNGRPASTSGLVPPAPQRRSTGGPISGQAANAKFAHRLRSAETEGDTGDSTFRPTSRNRRSLPPAMVASTSTRTGRSSPASSPTDRNGVRPPWNLSTAPVKATTDKVPSIAPSTRGSVRGISGATTRSETSVTGSGKRYVPKSVAEVKRQSLKHSASADSGVAGMWTAYRDGGAVDTPRKPAVQPDRQRGGRI